MILSHPIEGPLSGPYFLRELQKCDLEGIVKGYICMVTTI
jgi:hypothetical protein